MPAETSRAALSQWLQCGGLSWLVSVCDVFLLQVDMVEANIDARCVRLLADARFGCIGRANCLIIKLV
jgi:hypothetical protein